MIEQHNLINSDYQQICQQYNMMSCKSILPSNNCQQYRSQPKILPEEQKIYLFDPRTNNRQDTTGSTFGNQSEQNIHSNSFVFAIDAVITLRNLRTKGSVIQCERQKLQNRMKYLQRQSNHLLNSSTGQQYFQSFIQKERAKRVSRKYQDLLNDQKTKFQHLKRKSEVSSFRIKLKQTIQQKRQKDFFEKKKTVQQFRNKLNMGLMRMNKRNQESLEFNKQKRDFIINQQIKSKHKRKLYQSQKLNSFSNSLEEELQNHQKQVKRANILMAKLRQKQLQLEKKNIQSLDSYNKTLTTIKKLQSME